MTLNWFLIRYTARHPWLRRLLWANVSIALLLLPILATWGFYRPRALPVGNGHRPNAPADGGQPAGRSFAAGRARIRGAGPPVREEIAERQRAVADHRTVPETRAAPRRAPARHDLRRPSGARSLPADPDRAAPAGLVSVAAQHVPRDAGLAAVGGDPGILDGAGARRRPRRPRARSRAELSAGGGLATMKLTRIHWMVIGVAVLLAANLWHWWPRSKAPAARAPEAAARPASIRVEDFRLRLVVDGSQGGPGRDSVPAEIPAAAGGEETQSPPATAAEVAGAAGGGGRARGTWPDPPRRRGHPCGTRRGLSDRAGPGSARPGGGQDRVALCGPGHYGRWCPAPGSGHRGRG